MNDKGFTLIEVIAVIVVLVAIFLVSFPTLTNMAKSEEENKYNNMVDNLCTAGKTYMYSNLDEFKELSVADSVIALKIDELISYGNVDKELINPKTEKSVKNDTLEYTVLEDLSLECKYKEE